MFKKVSEVFFTILFFFFLVFATAAMVQAYIDDYNLVDAEKSEATIVAISANKGLFLPPAYFAKVNHGGKVNASVNEGYVNRISKNQMKNLDIGDKISGFTTNSSDFSTIRDFIFDSAIYLLAIFIFASLASCILIVLIGEIKIVDRFLTRLDRKSKKRSSGKWVGMVFLIFLICISGHFSRLYLSNLYHKVVPLAQTKTEAVIIDKEADISYRRHSDSSYEFTLQFNVGDDKIRTVKAVTRHTYHSKQLLEQIPITYRNSDPYDIFISGTDLADFLNVILYSELLIYLIFLVGFIWFGYYYVRRRWKKRGKNRR